MLGYTSGSKTYLAQTHIRKEKTTGPQTTQTILDLHVSGVTITHLQEHKTTAPAASGNHYTVLLSPAIVEELELI